MKDSYKSMGGSRLSSLNKLSARNRDKKSTLRSGAIALTAVAIAVGSSCPTSHAATIFVNTTDDELLSDSVGGSCTLREAVAAINSSSTTVNGNATGCTSSGSAFGTNDRIEFGAGLEGQTISTLFGPEGISLSRSLEFNRNNRDVSINSSGVSRGFSITGSNTSVILNSLTLTGGLTLTGSNNAQLYGSSIFANGGAELTISNSTITANTAGAAAAVFVAGTGSQARIENSVISNNVGQLGGAGANFGGGILLDAGATLEVINSTISGNNGGVGGGIFARDSNGITVRGTTISNNIAEQGSGLAAVNSSSATIENSTISGNTANSSGGLFLNGSNFTINFSTIADNSVPADQNIGGFILTNNSSISMQNTILSGSSFSDCFVTANSNFIANPNTIIENPNNQDVGCSSNARTRISPNLLPLADNGGPTMTHELGSGSAAFDTGNNCLATDQRGEPRPASMCNVGAWEGEDPGGGFFVVPTENGGSAIFQL